MKQERAKSAKGAITKSPDRINLPHATNLLGTQGDAPLRPLAALGPVGSPESGAPAQRVRKLVVAGTVCAFSVVGASLMILRPLAQTRPSTPEQLPIASGRQPSAPAQATYAVRVGPYHDPQTVLLAHKQLLQLGFKPLLVRGPDGTYLRALTTPTEHEATRVANGLKEQGYNALVIETAPETGPGRGKSADPQYHVDGVLVGFEGGQTKGWDGAGRVTGLRNSSLYSFQGEHSLEASIEQATPESPGTLRFQPESVVLPQDVFVARVLLPKDAKGRPGVRWYLVDANGKRSRDSGLPLRPGQWIATRFTLLPRVALPIQELGLEIVTPLGTSWSGTVYVDNVEQQRAR